MWLDSNELEIVVEKAQSMLNNNESSDLKVIDPPSQEDLDMKCPKCADTNLKAFIYAFDSGIELDRCPLCKGLWLDKSELEQLSTQVFQIDNSAAREFKSSNLNLKSSRRRPGGWLDLLGSILLGRRPNR